MKTIKLNLSDQEKLSLRKNGIKTGRLGEFAVDELAILMHSTIQRAQEISALFRFQNIPSVGPKFAADLVSMGYFSLEDLMHKHAPALFDELERKQGFWTDPCVEDQFLLVTYYARTKNTSKNWWDFTTERKAYRLEHGYPADRPRLAWHEVYDQAAAL